MKRRTTRKKNSGYSLPKRTERQSRRRPVRKRESEDVFEGLDYNIDLSKGVDSVPEREESEFFEEIPEPQTDSGDITLKDQAELEKMSSDARGKESVGEKKPGVSEKDTVSKIIERRATVRVKRTGRRDTSRVPVGLILLIAGALATIIISIIKTSFTGIDYSNFVFMLIVFTLAAHFDLNVGGGGKVNVGVALIIASFLALPRVEVVWIFLLGTLVTLVTKYMARWTKEELLGMLGDYVAIGIAAAFYMLLMKILPDKPQLFGRYTPWELCAVCLIGLLLFMLFLVREAYVLSHEGELPFATYFKSAMRQSWMAYLLLVLSGLLMGMIFRGIGIWYVLCVIPLLLLFIYTFNKVAKTDEYLLETIRVLSRIPEETGAVTRGYTEKVAMVTGEVAKELGLSPEDVQQVEYAAYLHGIGMVTIRPEEMGHRGSEEGAVLAGTVDILGKMEYLDVASEILKGREGVSERVVDVHKRSTISTGGGILQAAEDFVKLIQGKDDREPLSPAEALTEMNLERGSRYDSKVLRAIARLTTTTKEGSFLTDGEWSSEDPSFWRGQED